MASRDEGGRLQEERQGTTVGVDCLPSDTSRFWRVLRWEKTDRIRFMLRKVTLAAAEAGS